MIIDCHTHAFSEKIAERAVEQLRQYYRIPTAFGGALPDLLEQARLARLDGLILLVAATKPEQVKPAHDWILSLREDAFPPELQVARFGTYHVDDPHWLAEVNRLRAAGIRGIKLHPEFQDMDLADPRLYPFFEEIAGEFVLMVHVGDPRVSADNRSTPAKVATILRDFPSLTIIAAHLGGYCFWEQAYEALAGQNVYLDTSSALPYIDPALLRRLIDRHGADRLLLGSDYPLNSPAQALDFIDRYLPWLTDAQKAAVCGENCSRLLQNNR
jgi:hypothetical protein